ncbi:hypothetical protein PTKU46_94380 [Paraburkholderia terrae]
MLEAISERVANEELRREFLEEGNRRLANLLESGVGIEWADMRGYLRERAGDRAPELPKTKKWRD